MSARDVLIEAFIKAAERWEGYGLRRPDLSGMVSNAILADPRVGVVELPEESKDEDWRIDGYTVADDGKTVIPDFGSWVIERTGPALVLNMKTHSGDYDWRDIEPDEAERLAAALLAAARKAVQS